MGDSRFQIERGVTPDWEIRDCRFRPPDWLRGKFLQAARLQIERFEIADCETPDWLRGKFLQAERLQIERFEIRDSRLADSRFQIKKFQIEKRFRDRAISD